MARILNDGEVLSQAVRVDDDEAMSLIEARELTGRGLGWADMLLLASTLLTPDARLWTRDGRRAEAARWLGVAFQSRNGLE